MEPSGDLVTLKKSAYGQVFYLEPLYLTETKNIETQKDISRTHMKLF